MNSSRRRLRQSDSSTGICWISERKSRCEGKSSLGSRRRADSPAGVNQSWPETQVGEYDLPHVRFGPDGVFLTAGAAPAIAEQAKGAEAEQSQGPRLGLLDGEVEAVEYRPPQPRLVAARETDVDVNVSAIVWG